MTTTTRWCPHEGDAGDSRVCAHLRAASGHALPYHRWFLGRGVESDLVCPACAEARASGTVIATRELCKACFENVVDDHGEPRGVKGTPEVVVEPQPVDTDLDSTELGPSTIADVAVAADVAETTYVLTAEGLVLRVGHRSRRIDEVAQVTLPAEPDREPWSGHVRRPTLHVSHDGSFAAVAMDFGRFGTVVDLTTGRTTMSLDGGDYLGQTVPFSLAFAVHDDRPVLVHRTEWNRLDVSDPADGRLLTERQPTAYRQGESHPTDELDYFHGRLYPSPTGEHLLDDGWVWHPVGIPVVWSLDRWLSQNVWESETGASLRQVCARQYYWNHGLCWLDESRLAVEGIGDDDLEIVPGARIFDLDPIDQRQARFEYATEVGAFAGPTGRFFSDGARLFSSDANALSVWSIDRGSLIDRIEGFEPSVQSRLDRTLVEGAGSTVRRWRY